MRDFFWEGPDLLALRHICMAVFFVEDYPALSLGSRDRVTYFVVGI